MNKTEKTIWKELSNIIVKINEHDNSKTIFEKIKKWYENNQNKFSPNLIEKKQLEKLINIKEIEEYPIKQSDCTPKSVKNILYINPSNEASILSLVISKLWEIVVLRTDDECQICNSLGMFALFDLKAEKIILECSVCSSIQTIEGEIYNCLTPETWRLAENEDLKLAGLI
ncbi:conserved hypothetical protein [Hyella patelloides LEGE 07179]|uniref:Uncharacterized protein n=1 Tax=Hyella patelloides LEGE 07179 TaxID=945734 RepID=A0A563VWP4_9CYAN|nr:hypothetical protein [Hyella patelloides]VEP15831.1 conserved hypothetical protein [Hyella patelloides LEGE 07179]